MKHIIVLGDGMADQPVKSLGDKMLLQYVKTPHMDKSARMGHNGRLITVARGFHPGSGVANIFVLRHNPPKVYEGRGPLEATSTNTDLKPRGMAMRYNPICVEGETLRNHSSGHISTKKADVLIQYLQEEPGNDCVCFHTGVQYRHLLVIKEGNEELDRTPPHDVLLKPFRPLMARPLVPEAQETADLINDLIFKSQELLKNHPLNLKRISEGKDPANSIWPWSLGYRPQMPTLFGTSLQVKKGAVISTADSINGIGYYTGLRRIAVEGATGLCSTNYESKVTVVLEALKMNDFVHLHTEVSDEAGHEEDVDLKLLTIENLDKRAVGPIYEAVKDWDEPTVIAVLPDHPTPYELRTHTSDPTPFLVRYPGIEPGGVQMYDEISAYGGGYGVLKEDEFIKELMNQKNI